MSVYTDPIDMILTGLFAKSHAREPHPSPRATGRCPTCHYLVVLPCAVCAARPPVAQRETQVLVEQEQTPASTLSGKAREIFDLAVTWVQAHPYRELTAAVIDHDAYFPFQKQYVYTHYGKISLLNRLAREQAFPRS